MQRVESKIFDCVFGYDSTLITRLSPTDDKRTIKESPAMRRTVKMFAQRYLSRRSFDRRRFGRPEEQGYKREANGQIKDSRNFIKRASRIIQGIN